MKKIRYFNPIQIAAVALVILAIGCKKDESNELQLSRSFAPSAITLALTQTTAKISWPASLFTLPGAATYTVDISKDPNFGSIAFTATTPNLSVTVTENNILVRTDYYARVKALGAEGGGDSNYTISASFRMTGDQFLIPIPPTDATDVAVLVKWIANPALNKIVITPTAGGTAVTATITAADQTALQKAISGLAQLTSYSVEIFQDTKSKGILQFNTKASITGNIVDLTAITGNPGILATTLPTAPPGSVIVLRRGERYNITSSYNFDKSLTIVSQLAFGTNYASIRMSTFFNLVANSTIDSIVFKDLIIKGGRAAFASYDNDYILNANAAATVNKVHLENCNIKILRGVFRGQTAGAGTKYGTYFINNCVIDSIRDFGIATASATSAFANIKITNSTLYRLRRFISHPVAGSTSIVISDCTFNEVVAGSTVTPATNGFIDLGTFGSSISITNCIFGAVWNEAAAGALAFGYKAGSGTFNTTACFNTADFSNGPSSGSIAIPGLSAYSGTSLSVFTDSANPNGSVANFTVKDSGFPGKAVGDPRWK